VSSLKVGVFVCLCIMCVPACSPIEDMLVCVCVCVCASSPPTLFMRAHVTHATHAAPASPPTDRIDKCHNEGQLLHLLRSSFQYIRVRPGASFHCSHRHLPAACPTLRTHDCSAHRASGFQIQSRHHVYTHPTPRITQPRLPAPSPTSEPPPPRPHPPQIQPRATTLPTINQPQVPELGLIPQKIIGKLKSLPERYVRMLAKVPSVLDSMPVRVKHQVCVCVCVCVCPSACVDR
jgi:hypothetical protein